VPAGDGGRRAGRGGRRLLEWQQRRGPEESRRIYGDAKLARLATLKQAWDPDNVFHVNPNITPSSG
jgi:hypothetical protein